MAVSILFTDPEFPPRRFSYVFYSFLDFPMFFYGFQANLKRKVLQHPPFMGGTLMIFTTAEPTRNSHMVFERSVGFLNMMLDNSMGSYGLLMTSGGCTIF